MAQETKVAKKAETALAVADLLEQNAGAGTENIGMEDMAKPFLTLLQGLSKVVIKEPKLYRAGMFYNTVTREAFDGEIGINIVPIMYKHVFVEWTPRGAKSPFPVMEHSYEDGLKLARNVRRGEKNEAFLPSGNELVETFVYFVLHKTDNGPEPAIMTFQRTQLKKAASWNSVMVKTWMTGKNGRYLAPMFAYEYAITAVQEERQAGITYGYDIRRGSLANEQTILAAIALRDSLKESGAAVDYSKMNEEPAEEAGKPGEQLEF